MKALPYLLSATLLSGVMGQALASGTDPRDFNTYYAPQYRLPDPAGMSAAAVRGKELVHSTYKYLGAESGNRAANGRPYVGNKLACTSCHLDDATRPEASPLLVITHKYAPPGAYSPREGIYRMIEERINGCFERSLAGEAIPPDSQWMDDFKAYFAFLASGVQPGYTWKDVRGTGFPSVPLLTRAADPVRGATIYKDNCEKCHQRDGAGVWRDDEKRFRYPAVWGPDSFGLQAGMGRLATAVTLIKSAMPYDRVDVMDPSTRMSDADAWDVMAYLLSKSRPFDQRFIYDWSGVGPDGVPDQLKRAADASYDWLQPRVAANGNPSIDPADAARFPREQHIYGPFQPISEALKETRTFLGY